MREMFARFHRALLFFCLPSSYHEILCYDCCMSEDQEDLEEHLEEDEDTPVEPKAKKEKKKGDPVKKMQIGTMWYGENFKEFKKVDYLRQFLPAFKDLYYERKIADKTATTKAIVLEFNKSIAPEMFT